MTVRAGLAYVAIPRGRELQLIAKSPGHNGLRADMARTAPADATVVTAAEGS